MAYISGAVEGISDDRRALPGYNAAAQRSPWLVLVDLDHDFDCAPALVADWLPAPNTYMRFRVVVREIEAWLLADRERFASYFSVPKSALPDEPDEDPDPKSTLIAAVTRSRRKAIRSDMVPRPGSGRQVGAAYASRLIEFVSDTDQGWRPDVAAVHSPSLSSCLTRLVSLIEIAS